VVILTMTDGLNGPGAVDLRRSEAAAAAESLDCELRLLGLSDGELVANAATIGPIEQVINEIKPDIIYTHAEDDSHQDHRATASAVLAAGRNSTTILHFQAPSARKFFPQLFVGLEQEDLDRKVEALKMHSSQVSNSARVDLSAVAASASYWGSQARTELAEPFEVTRALFGHRRDHVTLRWTPDGTRAE
jgi:LmbE family N-acetylglucosaminyl deacetylase